MIGVNFAMSIQILHEQGISKKQIAKQLGLSINTVKKYLRNEGMPKYKQRPTVPRKLDPYKIYIQARVKEALPSRIPSPVIYREIQSQGYPGKIRQLREYLSYLRVSEEKTLIRFETEPGVQMQIDWAEFQRSPRLSAFVAVLGFSRASYVEFVEDEKLETLLSCHEHAFSFFGGVPKNCLYDNMKTVVIKRNAYGEGQHQFQKGLWDFAKHYHFLPKLCQPYRPCTKGKVERYIHYLRYSFYQPLITQLQQTGAVLDVEHANQEVLRWLREVSNPRVHGTTGQIPGEQLLVERNYLQSLPPPYRGVVGGAAPIGKRAHDAVVPAMLWDPDIALQHSLGLYDALAQGV